MFHLVFNISIVTACVMEHHNVIEVKAQFLFSQKVSFYISLTTRAPSYSLPMKKMYIEEKS